MGKLVGLGGMCRIQGRSVGFLKLTFCLALASTSVFAQTKTQDPPVPQDRVAACPLDQGTATVETLDQALSSAYMSNPELEAERARLRQRDEGVSQAIAEWRPSISGSLGQTHQRVKPDGPTSGNPSGRWDSTLQKTGSLNITQSLFEGGATYYRTKQAETNVLAGRQSLLSQEQRTLLDTVRVFLDVYTRERILVFLKASEKVLKSTVDQVQARYEVGDATRTDVAAVEANYAETVARRFRAEGDVENARADFLKIVGRLPGQLVFPKTHLKLPKNRQQAIQIAIQKNPSLRSAKFQEQSAAHNKQVQVAGLLPRISAEASASRSLVAADRMTPAASSFPSNLGQKSVSVTVSVSVPIYNRGTTHSQVRSAEQQRAEALASRQNVQRDVVKLMTEAWTRWLSAQKSKEQLILQVAANDLALRGVREEYSLGTKSLLDVLQIEEKWRESQIDLARIEQEEVIAQYGVLAIAGDLTVCALGLKVPYYDPKAYYKQHKYDLFGLE